MVVEQFSQFPAKLTRFLGVIITTKQLLIRWLAGNPTTTIRDLYYQDVETYQKKQANCNRYLQQIVVNSWMQSLEDDYGIYPSQKGLLFGNCKIPMAGNQLNLCFSLEPILIPILRNRNINIETDQNETVYKSSVVKRNGSKFTSAQPLKRLLINGIKSEYDTNEKGPLPHNVEHKNSYDLHVHLEPGQVNSEIRASKTGLSIIILEKEAIFQSFCRFLAENNPACQIIVVTGKGFPDRLTLRFVAYLSRHFATLISAFVDSDVYGISICKQYRFGNASQCSTGQNVDINYSGIFLLDYSHGWLNISHRDYTFMTNMLLQIQKLRCLHKNNSITCYELYKWHRELTRGLMLYKKSEMNLLDSFEINQYILGKLGLHHTT